MYTRHDAKERKHEDIENQKDKEECETQDVEMKIKIPILVQQLPKECELNIWFNERKILEIEKGNEKLHFKITERYDDHDGTNEVFEKQQHCEYKEK